MRSSLRVLVADDDSGDRRHILRLLARMGASVESVEASTADEAIAACQRGRFEIAFVDHLMPGQSGLHVVSALHDRDPHMAIVMVTGQGDELIAAEAIKRGASDYVPKRAISDVAVRRLVESVLQKKELERQLARQQEELASFASVLAHDLAAPLRAVRGFAGCIEADLAAQRFDSVSQSCGVLVSSVKRMESLLAALFEYTQAAKTIDGDAVCMSAALDDALDSLRVDIDERRLELTRDRLPIVLGRRPLLAQLLQNLVANAIKFCDEKAPAVHVGAERVDIGWRLSVRDNGIGIPEKDLQRVFEPFKRLHARSRYPGTGLGLATCRRIVERHGGEIWCESVERAGTTFHSTLRDATPGTCARASTG